MEKMGVMGELQLQSKLEILRDTNKSRGEPLEQRYLETAAASSYNNNNSNNNAKKPSPKSPHCSMPRQQMHQVFFQRTSGGLPPPCHLATLPRCVVIECHKAQHGQSSLPQSQSQSLSLFGFGLFARLGAHLWVVVSAKNGTRRETNFSAHLSPCLYSWLHKVRQCRRQLLIYGQWQVRFSHRLLRLVFVSVTSPCFPPLPHFSLLLLLLILTSLLLCLSPPLCIDLCIGRQCVRCPPHSCINRTCCPSLYPALSLSLSLPSSCILFIKITYN